MTTIMTDIWSLLPAFQLWCIHHTYPRLNLHSLLACSVKRTPMESISAVIAFPFTAALSLFFRFSRHQKFRDAEMQNKAYRRQLPIPTGGTQRPQRGDEKEPEPEPERWMRIWRGHRVPRDPRSPAPWP